MASTWIDRRREKRRAYKTTYYQRARKKRLSWQATEYQHHRATITAARKAKRARRRKEVSHD